MPDANGDPTDNELVSSLGWTESEGDSLASDIGTGTEPSQPVAEAAPEVTAPQVPPPTGTRRYRKFLLQTLCANSWNSRTNSCKSNRFRLLLTSRPSST